jgi:hypothetical protein
MPVAERPPLRSMTRSVLVVGGAITTGLTLRLVPMGLPDVVVKHGGSVLWAVMVYAIVAALSTRWSPRRCGIVAGIVAGGIELSQLCHHPLLDAVRASRVGALLLGRVFSVGDLIVYTSTIMIAVIVDRAIARIRRKGRPAASCGPAPARSI